MTKAFTQLTTEEKCTDELYIDPSADDMQATISSPGYPSLYGTEESQIWCISASENVTLSLICDVFDIPKVRIFVTVSKLKTVDIFKRRTFLRIWK